MERIMQGIEPLLNEMTEIQNEYYWTLEWTQKMASKRPELPYEYNKTIVTIIKQLGLHV